MRKIKDSHTEYLVDPNQAYAQVLEEWGASAASGPLPDETLATTYVYGDDLISQTKLALAGPSITSVYHYDGLGTTRALSAYKVDAAGVPQAGHGELRTPRKRRAARKPAEAAQSTRAQHRTGR